MRFTINSLAICLARARIANPRQRGATVNISANEIRNANRILHKATINAGAPNQKVILAPKPIKMEWSLQRHQVLLPGR
jgi:hypothetical protein